MRRRGRIPSPAAAARPRRPTGLAFVAGLVVWVVFAVVVVVDAAAAVAGAVREEVYSDQDDEGGTGRVPDQGPGSAALLQDLIDGDEDDRDSPPSSGGLVFDLRVDAAGASTTAATRSRPNNRTSTPSRVLLLEAAGHLRNGRVCGLLGPSGSGKTTLLASLLRGSTLLSSGGGGVGVRRHGRVWRYSRVPSSGGNSPTDTPSSRIAAFRPIYPSQVAYLQQQDDFFELLTARETLQLGAFLELPHVPDDERRRLVQDLLERLGLAAAADHRIGSASDPHGGKSRLSGGERRRLSVALELVTEKQLVVADEPTTGLDAALSVQVLRLLKQLAHWNDVPCVISLHQPRSSIYNDYLDDVMLLAPGGRLCYAGSTTGALSYFARLGHPVPPATNPAEFLVDLVSVDADNRTQAALDKERIDRLAEAFRERQLRDRERRRHRATTTASPPPQLAAAVPALGGKPSDVAVGVQEGCLRAGTVVPGDWVRRLAALWRRSWRQNARNRTVNLFRAVASAGNAVLLAQIFPTVRGTLVRANSVADRVALLSFGAINQCMMAYVKTAELFSKERPVVHRERMRHQYSALEYLLAKVGGELVLDAGFAAIFAAVLKACSGVRITWSKLTGAFSLLTVAGASLGFAVGSWAPSEQLANTAGIPIMVILMVVGVINPSGVDPSKPKPAVVRFLKQLSPFASCIEALCLGEYPGMTFVERGGWFRRVSSLPRMGGLALVRDGDQVIQALGLGGVTYEGAMKHLALLCAGNLLASWLGLLFHQRAASAGKPKRRQAAPCSSRGRSTDSLARSSTSEMQSSRDPANNAGLVALPRVANQF